MFAVVRRSAGCRAGLALLVLTLVALTAQACNIPVFRYALERWRPDVSQFIVFHRGPLTAEHQGQIDQFRQRAEVVGANAQVTLVDLAQAPARDTAAAHSQERALWQQLSSQANPTLELPYLLVRLPHTRGLLNAWHGPLTPTLQAALVESPVRSELTRRLLLGDAIVWLLIRSPDEERNAPVRKLLTEQCRELSSTIVLPEGIGLPGSELFSEVPLLLRFSVIEIDRGDVREQFLLNVFENFQPAAFDRGEPLLVPVFGRGRALEVIPAEDVSSNLIADLTAFLSGACSCQVKEQNPGFDLLLSANWDAELFGEDAPLPPPAKSIGQGDRGPVLLTIPPGR